MKNKVLLLTKILWALFAIGTIVMMLMVYTNMANNLDDDIILKFGISYLFLSLILLLYVPTITILNLRNYKLAEIRKRLFKFIALFILFGTFNYTIDYIFRPLKVDFFRAFSHALGLSFGLSFIDVVLFQNRKK